MMTRDLISQISLYTAGFVLFSMALSLIPRRRKCAPDAPSSVERKAGGRLSSPVLPPAPFF